MTMIADNIYNLVRKTLITTENNNDVNASIMTMAAVNIYNLVRKTLIMLIIIMKVVIINCQNNGDDDDDIYICTYACIWFTKSTSQRMFAAWLFNHVQSQDYRIRNGHHEFLRLFSPSRTGIGTKLIEHRKWSNIFIYIYEKKVINKKT